MILLLQSQTKVAFKSHPKILSLFCNHISWYKKWSERPFPCNCATLIPFLGLDIKAKHVSALGHNTSSIFDHVLHSNLNNVCSPNILSFPEEFLSAFMAYFYNVVDFCEIFKEPITFLPLVPPTNYFKNKAFNRLTDILQSYTPQSPHIVRIIQEFDIDPLPYFISSSKYYMVFIRETCAWRSRQERRYS